MGGIIANDPAEAVYLVNQEDGGNKLAGDRRYELRFEQDTLPPVDSFWSQKARPKGPSGPGFRMSSPLQGKGASAAYPIREDQARPRRLSPATQALPASPHSSAPPLQAVSSTAPAERIFMSLRPSHQAFRPPSRVRRTPKAGSTSDR